MIFAIKSNGWSSIYLDVSRTCSLTPLMSQSNGIRSEGVVAARISALQSRGPRGPSGPSGGAAPRPAPALAGLAGVRRLGRCHGCLGLGGAAGASTILVLASGIRRLWVWAARSVSVHLELFIFLIYCPHEIEYHPYFDEAV